MDHSSHLSHSGHMGHDMPSHDMPMPAMCSMNMLFTWDTTNLCVVFSSWRVTGPWSLIWTVLGVVALTAGYEAVREISRRIEARDLSFSADVGNASGSGSNFARKTAVAVRNDKIVKAALYGVQVFYSFFVMLLFMTYNGWIMLAVGFGAFLGYLIFSGAPSTKSAACH